MFRILTLGLMVLPASVASGAQSLTVDGLPITSIKLEPGQSCIVGVVSNDNRSYEDYVGFDNGEVHGAFSHVETKPGAGDRARVTEYKKNDFYGYYVRADGSLFGSPDPGIHFVFEYEAQKVGETDVKLYDKTLQSVIDFVHITVIPKPMGTVWTYQGELIDANDVADGLYDFEFKLYRAPTGGIQGGNTIDINDLDVIDGHLTVELDFGIDVFAGEARWLEIGVRPGDSKDVHTILSPRQKLTPMPYALYAKTAGSTSDSDWMVSGNDMYSMSSGSVGIGTMNPREKITVHGTVESTSGEFKFPDGSVQTTSATVPLAEIEALIASLEARIEALENPPGWGTAELIETDNAGSAGGPKVSVDAGGNAIAVWSQSDGTHSNIWSNRYVTGAGWGTAELIETDDAGTALNPQVGVDGGGNAVAVWAQSDANGYNIWSNRYVTGSGWGTAELIETNTRYIENLNPQVAVDAGGNSIAVWSQSQSDGYCQNIWSNRYVAGSGWGTPELIQTDTSKWAENPEVAVDDVGNAVAVWKQSETGFPSSEFTIWSNRYVAGSGWGTAELIGMVTGLAADWPQVAVDVGGNAIAVWEEFDGNNLNIYSGRYVAGTGWGTIEPIETANGVARFPQVAVDGGGNAVAVWTQLEGGSFSIWSNRYVAGAGWGTAELIEIDNVGDAEPPQVAVDVGGNAVAVWRQDDGTRENIWSNRYVAGVGWGMPKLLERDNTGSAGWPHVAVGGGNAVAVWQQSDGTRDNIWSNRYVK